MLVLGAVCRKSNTSLSIYAPERHPHGFWVADPMGALGNLPDSQPLACLAGNPGTNDGNAQALLGPRASP